MGDIILSYQSRRVWQVRLGDRVAILPGQAGTNLRRTARYAEEDPDPLQQRHGPNHRFSEPPDSRISIRGRQPIETTEATEGTEEDNFEAAEPADRTLW